MSLWGGCLCDCQACTLKLLVGHGIEGEILGFCMKIREWARDESGGMMIVLRECELFCRIESVWCSLNCFGGKRRTDFELILRVLLYIGLVLLEICQQ